MCLKETNKMGMCGHSVHVGLGSECVSERDWMGFTVWWRLSWVLPPGLLVP